MDRGIICDWFGRGEIEGNENEREEIVEKCYKTTG
jgi:hypothetical protein